MMRPRSCKPRRTRTGANARLFVLCSFLVPLALGRAGAQESPGALPLPGGDGPGAGETPEAAAPVSSPIARAVKALGKEAKRYGTDSVALLTAPARWNAADWKKAAGATVILGGLLAVDEKLDQAAQNHRTGFTNRVSAATTSLGGGDGVKVSAGLLVVGLLSTSDSMRDMGREAIEAGVFTQLIDNLLLKRAFGRERPSTSGGRTDFDPGSRNSSFPSGHATEAFSVASVVAMRARGWVIPAIAYAAATVVAFDRVNDHVHFPSDVFAGAVLGTATGRFLVSRHRREEGGADSGPRLEVFPSRHGLTARLTF